MTTPGTPAKTSAPRSTSRADRVRALLARKQPLVMGGFYDGVSARLVEHENAVREQVVRPRQDVDRVDLQQTQPIDGASDMARVGGAMGARHAKPLSGEGDATGGRRRDCGMLAGHAPS